jgi:chemotaxis protein CheD
VNIVVGVSDMSVSDDPESSIVTYSLGSCIGVAIHDPVARVGGILHFMLPESELDSKKAITNPFMFCDTGIPALFKAAYNLGAKKQRMKVVIAGGSQILDQDGFFNIGKRNVIATKKMFWRNNVFIDHEDTGGNANRTIRLDVNSGRVLLKISGVGEMAV